MSRLALSGSRASAVVAAVVALLWVAMPATASAAVLRLHDARHDVWKAPAVGDAVPAPTVGLDDITRAVVRHDRRHVTVALHYVALGRTGPLWQFDVVLDARRDRTVREFVVSAGPGRWRGTLQVLRRDGSAAPHCGASWRIDYGHESFRLVVPDRCLHRSPLIRAKINSYRAGADRSSFYSDNPQNTDAEARTWTRWVSNR